MLREVEYLLMTYIIKTLEKYVRTSLHWNHILGQPWQWSVLKTLSGFDCSMKLVPKVNPSRNPLLSFFNCFKQRCRTWITEEWIRFGHWPSERFWLSCTKSKLRDQQKRCQDTSGLEVSQVLVWIDTLNNQIHRAQGSAMVWWKWLTSRSQKELPACRKLLLGRRCPHNEFTE